MKRIFSLFLGLSLFTSIYAQDSPLETARGFMNSGDWDNAILVLNSAIRQNPDNLELHKYLVLSYTYKREFAKALEVVKPVLDRDDLDVQMYQAAGNVYRALSLSKDG